VVEEAGGLTVELEAAGLSLLASSSLEAAGADVGASELVDRSLLEAPGAVMDGLRLGVAALGVVVGALDEAPAAPPWALGWVVLEALLDWASAGAVVRRAAAAPASRIVFMEVSSRSQLHIQPKGGGSSSRKK
jgi:hypothetical protein